MVLNGPNLNLLGHREPATYGSATLQQINERLSEQAEQNSIKLECYQTNAEHQMIERIQATLNSGISHITSIQQPGLILRLRYVTLC